MCLNDLARTCDYGIISRFYHKFNAENIASDFNLTFFHTIMITLLL